MGRLVAVAVVLLSEDDITLAVIHHILETVAESMDGGQQRITVAAAVSVEVQLHGGILAKVAYVEAACHDEGVVNIPGFDPLQRERVNHGFNH